MAPDGEVTRLLANLQAGDQSAVDQLAPLLYAELRRLAGGLFQHERPDHTLQPTALVHEAYLKMVGQTAPGWQTRANFLGVAARVMRQILVDHARSHRAAKRGGGGQEVEFSEALEYGEQTAPAVVALHDALDELSRLDARKAQVVELRYFGGMTGEEIAEFLGASPATVARDLRVAQSWLSQRMKPGPDGEG